jgi:hypothetical protein
MTGDLDHHRGLIDRAADKENVTPLHYDANIISGRYADVTAKSILRNIGAVVVKMSLWG